MWHSLRNTLVAGLLSLSTLGLAYGLSERPVADAPAGFEAIRIAQVTDAGKTPRSSRLLFRRSGAAMPYFSFGPVLPRQER
jgi:hypothetical protein